MAKTKRLYAVDLDGTLLRNNKTISFESELFIRDLVDENVSFVLVTGRTYARIRQYISQLSLKGYVVCNDGCYIYSTEGSLLKSELELCLKLKDVEDIVANIPWCFYGLLFSEGKEVIFGGKNKIFDLSYVVFLIKKYLKKSSATYISYRDLRSLDDNMYVEKIQIKTLRGASKSRLLKKELVSKYQVFFVEDENKIQIMSLNVNKARGLKYVQNLLGIDDEHTYVFGNDGNDCEMLSSFGNSYAVGNAEYQCKQVASHVIGTNEEDGVCEKIREIEEKIYGRCF